MTKPEFNAIVAEKIKYIRTVKQLTQTELAKRSGVSRISINRVERGHNAFDMFNYYKIATALEVDMSLFFGPENLVEVLNKVKKTEDK